eukprot:TRINITY_DN1502_c2_g1_i2.p1 TRINITY_DN1502_c2_g1~~TRINITY_DN1502_c2_g1_i2.p1  ORF type:complete len:236 (-),score=78.01 TRINITY_DN1502_c2_g1_i2:163-870(-)
MSLDVMTAMQAAAASAAAGSADPGAGVPDDFLSQAANPEQLMAMLTSGDMPAYMTDFAEHAAALDLNEQGVAPPVVPTLSSPFPTMDPADADRVAPNLDPSVPHRTRSVVDPVAADLVPAFASGSSSRGGSGRRSGSLQRSLSRLEGGGYASRTVPEDAFVNTLGVRLASSAAVTSNVGQVTLLQPTHVNTAASVSPFAVRGGGGRGRRAAAASVGSRGVSAVVVVVVAAAAAGA